MNMVHRIFRVLLCFLLGSVFTAAQKPETRPITLLDHLTGSWVLQGIIADKRTAHDVDATWVLNHEYVQLHEISREKNDSGGPEYEAIVLPELGRESATIFLPRARLHGRRWPVGRRDSPGHTGGCFDSSRLHNLALGSDSCDLQLR